MPHLNPKGIQHEVFDFRSPVLIESLLGPFPALTNMLKFRA